MYVYHNKLIFNNFFTLNNVKLKKSSSQSPTFIIFPFALVTACDFKQNLTINRLNNFQHNLSQLTTIFSLESMSADHIQQFIDTKRHAAGS